jgi:DNA-binding transcriptional LysR family regulator
MAVKFDLVTLELFIAIVEEQSIARAAERAHIAASAVSRRISDMEAMLRVDLFTRHPKGIELTPAGIALLRHARTLQGNLSLMETELVDYERGLRGLIRIAANKSAILESLPDEIAAFLRDHRQVRIEFEEATSPAIVAAVADNTADVGIYGGNIPAPDLIVLPYREDELQVVVPAGHRLANHGSLRFADLVEHDFVCLERGSSIETLCLRAAAELGCRLKLRVRVGGFDALLRLIGTGLGIGIVPRQVLEGDSRHAGLTGIRLEESWSRRPINLCIRSHESLPVAARLLVAHLTAGRDPSPPAMAPCANATSPGAVVSA